MGITAFCRRRRWVTGTALGLYALVASGLPLPLGALSPHGLSDGFGDQLFAAKDRSRPFPCRDRPCGCVSAEQCFKTCCCHTPAQLLAWARRNDLEPAVLAALERRAATEIPAATIVSAASCCTAPVVLAKATCCTVDAPAVPSNVMTDCCSTGRSPSSDGAARVVEGDPEPHADDEPLSRRTVVLKAMLACGGIVAEWFSIGGAPPPPAVVAVACISPLAVTLVDRDASLRPRHVAPDVPPPRVT